MSARKTISIDVSTCFGKNLIKTTEFSKAGKAALKVESRIKNEVDAGRLGFWKLPFEMRLSARLKPIVEAAEAARANRDTLVIVGIGGSSLGTRMMVNALKHRYYNELPGLERGGMKIYFLENSDPDSFKELTDRLDLSHTLFNIVSKSGSTVETAAQYALVRELLMRRLPDTWKKHLLFTTDPEEGSLRKMAEEEGIAALEVPSDVGGRFSMLSAVGLFPALCLGLNVKDLLSGAADMAGRCTSGGLFKNPALTLAVIHHMADTSFNKNMAVIFPYADKLQGWAEWFCQLWAESLGKALDEKGNPAGCGTTPIKALGAIDQHSQMQLYIEGPNDKLFVFVRNEKFNDPAKFPPRTKLPAAYDYLAGHSMSELIQAEEAASRFALTKTGRMSYEIRLPGISEYTLGQLLFLGEAMTAYAGYLYGVNPFDQPGVELGKKYAYGLMGRKGYESYAAEMKKTAAADAKFII
mgnify:CR=1 FL=1